MIFRACNERTFDLPIACSWENGFLVGAKLVPDLSDEDVCKCGVREFSRTGILYYLTM